jgi:hypothetical protein
MALGVPMGVSEMAKAQSPESEASARAALVARCKAATAAAPQYPVWLQRVLEAA